ncbi:MAG TPA: thiol reductant ABC exporter subunit CydC [Solirubrobacteraceae bacterium]|nr:thiol reductant ABC exporter subunit CydC [Solirubrobacteraceae bacterium]
MSGSAPTSVGSLLRLVKLPVGERPRLVLAIVLAAGAAAAAIALLATSGYLISRAAQRPQILALMVAIVAVRAFGLGRAALRYGERLSSHDLALRQLARMRTRFFALLAPLVPGEMRRRKGDLLGRFVADVDTLSDLYLRALIPVVVAAVVIVGTSAAAWVMLPAAGPVVLASLLLSATVVPWTAASLAARADRRQGALRERLLGELVESIEGAEELLVCGHGASRIATLDELDAELSRHGRRDALAAGLAGTLGGALSAAGLLAVLAVGVSAVHASTLAGVLLAALAFLLLGAYESLTPLPAAARSLRTCAAAGARLQELDRRPPAVRDPPAIRSAPQAGALRAEGVSYGYEQDGRSVLDGVELELEPGRSLALLGPSGAGKSTLAELLVRFRDPDEGRVTLGGVDLRELREDDVRAVVLLCGQDAHLFHTSIRENLRLARQDAADAEIVEALAGVQLADWVAGLPQGLDTIVGGEGDGLSGGQRQRLALARALLSNARFVIFDEPTAHLEPQLARRVVRRLLDGRDGKGVLLITHDRSLAELCEASVCLAQR